jgi:hypothetical protein
MTQKYFVEDYIGKKINRWTIIKKIDSISKDKKNYRINVLARCECGTEKEVCFYNIAKENSKSCGCYSKEISSANYKKINIEAGKELHGMTDSHTYNCWISMRSRCYITTNNRYYLYGAKGIIVCEEWKNSFNKFFIDMGKAPTKYHSIDRIDSTKNYCKENCHWATPKEQSNNRTNCHYITYKNKTKTMMNWAKELNLNYNQFCYFINTKKMSINEAILKITKPYQERTRSDNQEYHQIKACTNM